MGIGFSELILILVIILVVFGPGKLPEIGKALGGGIREFKDAQQTMTSHFTGKIEQSDSEESKNN